MEFIELNVSVHDGILDIVNILLDFTYRLLGGAKTLQLFINRSNSGLGGGDTGVVSIHLALSYLLFCGIIPEGGGIIRFFPYLYFESIRFYKMF